MLDKFPIPAGQIVMFTDGEYEDYQVKGVFRVLRNITLDSYQDVFREIVEGWETTAPDVSRFDPAHNAGFVVNIFLQPLIIGTFVNNGYLEKIEAVEINIDLPQDVPKIGGELFNRAADAIWPGGAR